ncbi:MAG: hypothetical protein R3A49_12555 [Acidimicrobiia bacterium]
MTMTTEPSARQSREHSGAGSARRRRHAARRSRVAVAGASAATLVGLVTFLGLSPGAGSPSAAPPVPTNPAGGTQPSTERDTLPSPRRVQIVVRRQVPAGSGSPEVSTSPESATGTAAPSVAPAPSPSRDRSTTAPVAQSRGSN